MITSNTDPDHTERALDAIEGLNDRLTADLHLAQQDLANQLRWWLSTIVPAWQRVEARVETQDPTEPQVHLLVTSRTDDHDVRVGDLVTHTDLQIGYTALRAAQILLRTQPDLGGSDRSVSFRRRRTTQPLTDHGVLADTDPIEPQQLPKDHSEDLL